MKELTEGVDFYYSEKGLMVMTARFHLERGYCCGNGCRHCPYGYEKISEPRRSELIAKQKANGHTPEKN